MIELLLQAEDALGLGRLDRAEQMYWQAIERDPQNAMAVVGLARVAIERGDDRTALAFGRRALDIDPENAAARRLTARLEEVLAYRGEAPARRAGQSPAPRGEQSPARGAEQSPAPGPPSVSAAAVPEPQEPAPIVAPEPQEPPRRGLLRRLLGRG